MKGKLTPVERLRTALLRHAPNRIGPRARRVLQAVLYEIIAVAVVGPTLGFIFAEPVESTVVLALFMSTVALAWSYAFNGWFERWEARQPVKRRSWPRRLAHGLGLEGGLVVMLVPVMAWWLNTSLFNAFMADLGVLAFFLGYAVVYTWAFDRIFGLPQLVISADAVHVPATVDVGPDSTNLAPDCVRFPPSKQGSSPSDPTHMK